ncbi:MAG: hypothetical protein ACP5IC_02015 [Minisyncoccia bacterium]
MKKLGLSWNKIISFGLEYKYVALYLQNKIDLKTMKIQLLKQIQHYIKRQITWFKKDKEINWVSNYNQAEKLISKTIFINCY